MDGYLTLLDGSILNVCVHFGIIISNCFLLIMAQFSFYVFVCGKTSQNIAVLNSNIQAVQIFIKAVANDPLFVLKFQ